MSTSNVTGMSGGEAGTVFAGGRVVKQSVIGCRDTVCLAGVEAGDINIGEGPRIKEKRLSIDKTMPRDIKVNAGDGGKMTNLNVAGHVSGGVGNTGSAQPPSKNQDDNDDTIEVNGPTGELEAENVTVSGVVEGGMNNNYSTGTDAPATGSKEKCYKMDAEPRGLCYIFNNKKFENKQSRTGTDNDRDKLERVFEKLKFKVKTFEDSDADVMELKVRKLSKMDHKDYDCVIVIFLTHGKDGEVEGSDNEWLKINTITSFFRADVCPSLANKPKLFFFQSCRGNIFQKAAKVDGDGADGAVCGTEVEELVAPEADFFLGYSTVSGTKSLRNVETGSWFIQELVRVFDANADKEDLLGLMTQVQSGVNEHKAESEDGSFIRQTAEMSSRLLKKLYF